MEMTSLILSIVASIGTIISLIINMRLKSELESVKQQLSGKKNVQSRGDNVINNTGDNSTFKR